MNDTTNKPSLRMQAYYYGFTPTGVEAIDLILSAIAHAGKGYHNTEDWREPIKDYGRFRGGKYGFVGWIQRAAEDAAERMRSLEGLARELASVYTVDTDQAALIRLVAEAKRLAHDLP